VSLLALTTALHAQDMDAAFVLDPINIIRAGEDNIEATGGTVLTQDDLEKLQPADVSELFARESTVSVTGGASPAKKIHVLGMEQSNLAVSVDGVPQTSTSWHHTGSNVIDPAFLKRVEVEAGAAAADSGFGAAAGAIRYETVSADDMLEEGQTTGGRVALSYGSNGRGASASLASYGRYKNIDWFVMAHKTDGSDYKSGDGTTVEGTEPAAESIVAKMGYEVEDHRFELSFERSRDEADRLIKMNLGLDGDELHPLKVSRDSVKLSYTSTNPTSSWDPEATIYFSQNDYWRDNYSPTQANGNMILNEDQLGGKVQNTFAVGAGKITAGIDFNQHDYHTDNYGANDRQYRNFSTTQVGAYVQGRFEFDNGFNLSTGARFDASRFTDWDGNRFSDTGASYNATLAYKVNQNLEFFAAGSKTWLGYDLGDYGYIHARTDAFYTDPSFSASEAENIKLGANFGGNNWKGGVTFFDTKLNGLPAYGYTTDNYMLYNDQDEYRSRGVTLNGSYDFGQTRVGATFTKADVTIGGVSAVPDSSTFMPIGNMATLYVDHELPNQNMTVGATVEWAGKISDAVATAAGFYDQEAYTVVNVYAEWMPQSYENLALRLSVDNLFDENYYERSSYAASSNRGGIDPVYAPGRTITVGASLKF
jgi:hemoglobin/transferrin/lactoferrin receptor protein